MVGREGKLKSGHMGDDKMESPGRLGKTLSQGAASMWNHLGNEAQPGEEGSRGQSKPQSQR